MTMSMAASHARGKKSKDCIFALNSRAQEEAKVLGKDKVINGTIGSIMDENGDIVFLKTVEKEYLNLPRNEYVAYAPIAGLPDYLEAVVKECFGESKPDAFIEAVATAGGTGGIHHLVHNYTNAEDTVLTADWYWGAYNQICNDNHRYLKTYQLFDENREFNFQSFKAETDAIAAAQENVVLIFNSPGNNPTGFSLTDADWDKVIAYSKELVQKGKNKVIIACDVAYIDYSGEKQTVRRFFKKFSHLPKEILVVVCYSLSKGFTMYGQRVGAMIGVSSDEEVAHEFKEINAITSRATWSNICRPAMRTMANIVNDPAKLAAYEAERNEYCELIQDRARIFVEEAKTVGLPCLPYCGGFFLTIPTEDSMAIVEALANKHIFVVPLGHGVRVAACSVTKAKMQGLATTIYNTMKELGAL
ncbi:pyridoxal phosphate-dependent aminotransferase [uncultured Veillonella sp.]|uniref:pyridoxal phosphate-dependent aminotransferase n=1 Tax=uncultured Veillonella sp. TaxID=159268 RepID=UPI00260ED2D8|nr:aminotransferase class I/II-fold pyridoxal phosphate-dependent enzyme [uncultured Veillonella sp.]